MLPPICIAKKRSVWTPFKAADTAKVLFECAQNKELWDSGSGGNLGEVIFKLTHVINWWQKQATLQISGIFRYFYTL